MNVVLDGTVSISKEYQEAFSSLLPNNSAPLILDSMKGISGTPDDKEGYIFLTNLTTDVLGYHGKFFESHKNAPQWFFILLNKNDHGVMLLKDSAIKYDLKNCTVLHAPDHKSFNNAVETIAAAIPLSDKVLLYAKHKKTRSMEELAYFLFDDDQERYEIQYSTSYEKSDASILLLCGQEERDFKIDKLPENMEPIFVVLCPENNVQQFINSESFIEFLSQKYSMTSERVEKRLYFVSTSAEAWMKEMPVGDEAINKGILLWDSFGLPVLRSEYTLENIRDFINSTYKDGKRLKSFLAGR